MITTKVYSKPTHVNHSYSVGKKASAVIKDSIIKTF